MRFIRILSIVLLLAGLGWIATFQIIDLDVWWHIAAGRMMRQTGEIITTDPFAFTRVGQPYLAIHEWLAQILLSFLFDAFGPAGLITLRVFCIVAAFGALLLPAWRRAWILLPVFIPAALVARPGFLDRPQLFSFLLFSIGFVLCHWFLSRTMLTLRRRVVFVASLFFIMILWVNLHGAAALLLLGLLGATACQRLFVVRERVQWMQEGLFFLSLTCLLFLGLFLTPAGFETIGYLQSLLQDQTVGFIREWTPRPLGQYLTLYAFFWIVPLVWAISNPQKRIFHVLTLLMFGGLSLTAQRHEAFFLFAACGVTASALPQHPFFAKWLDAVERRKVLWVGCNILMVIASVFVIRRDNFLFLERNGWQGIGAVEPYKGAVDFLERAHLEGRAFNSYEVGAYLLYRGRKVFVDGRNVEYGYDYLADVFASGVDAKRWEALVDRYDLSLAIIGYDYYRSVQPLPYVSHLGSNPQWRAIFIDDATVIYARGGADGYRILTPEILLVPSSIASVPGERLTLLESELRRSIEVSPTHLRASVALGWTLVAQGKLAEAQEVLRVASERNPHRYEPIEALGVLRFQEERWLEARALFEEAVDLAGGSTHASLSTTMLQELATRGL